MAPAPPPFAFLTARITLADRHRLALLRLNYRNFWESEIAELEVENSGNFQSGGGHLQATGRALVKLADDVVTFVNASET